eukprot:2275144-Ditylum_brightwellii.AAC.1
MPKEKQPLWWTDAEMDIDEMICVVIDLSTLLNSIVSLDDNHCEFKALIHLLDALNHTNEPNAMYSYEGTAGTSGTDGLSGMLIARAVGSLEKGDKLTMSYDSQPLF